MRSAERRPLERRDGMSQSRPVRNRDIAILERVLYAMQEARHAEDASIFAQERMTGITRHITGMPRGNSGKAGFEDTYAAMEEAGERYAARLEDALALLKRAEDILNGMENENARTFAVMMYVMQESPQEIRSALNMSEWGFRQARRAMEQATRMKLVKWSGRWQLEEK